LLSKAVELVLPGEEAHCFNNGWLYDLLAWEDTPCNSVRSFVGSICLQIAILIHSIVGEFRIAFETRDDLRDVFRRDEDLQVSLLVDITITRAPTKYRV